MLFGIEWDTSTSWAFAWSILPILLRGMVVTIQASLLGFFVALGLGLLLASLKGVPLKIIAWPAALVVYHPFCKFRLAPLAGSARRLV